MTRPFFTRERISDFDIYDKNCDISLDLAQARLGEGYPIEFQVNSASPTMLLIDSLFLPGFSQ
jgi:hypothetical protein